MTDLIEFNRKPECHVKYSVGKTKAENFLWY